MPLYEYQCDACGHRFEAIQKFSDPLVETCPKCGGAVRKLVAAPAFQFKGSGWYITDYAKKDAGGKADASSKDTSTPGEGAKSDKSEKTSEKSAPADSAAPAASSSGTSGSKEKAGG